MDGNAKFEDLFHAAPNALRNVNHATDIAIDPVVRVDLTTAAMTPMLAKLVELETQMPPELK